MEKYIQILVFVVCAALAVPSASAKCKANEGEKCWCHNILSAKNNNVVKYCIDTEWNNLKPMAASCREGVLFVKKAYMKTTHLHNHAAKLNAIAGLCNDFEDQTRSRCKSLMVEAAPEVLQLVNSTLSPSVTGDLLGLCTSRVQPKKIQRDSKICHDCKAFIKDIEETFIGPDAQEAMRVRMEQVCQEVPDSFFNMCKSMSDDWIKHFFLYLNDEMHFETMCALFLPCSSTDHKRLNDAVVNTVTKVKNIISPVSDVTCKTCMEVMEDVRDFIKTPQFQEEAEDFMAATLCNLMPHHMIHECKHRISRYGNLIFDLLIAGFDSQLTCQAVRMCPQTQAGWQSVSFKGMFKNFFTRAVKNYLPVSNMMPIFEIFGDSLGGTECSLCQLLFREVERVIADESSESQITTAMFEACNLLPEPWADECNQFVKDNGKKIIEDILHNLPPKEICFSFGFCLAEKQQHRAKRDTTIYVISEDKNAKTPKIPHKDKKDTPVPAVTHGGSAWCQICNQIAGIVQRILASQQLNLGMDTIYQEVCKVLPRSIASRCARISKHMINGVLGGVSSVAQPQLICGAIGVCDMTLTPMNYSVPLPDLLKPPYH